LIRVLLEACLDSLDLARKAEQAGAGRIELCDRLEVGGTTPDQATIEAVVAAVGIPVFPIIRPRGGDFVHSAAEVEAMKRDARMAARAGAAGIVLGVLRSDGTIDQARTREVMDAAPDLPATFHLAFEKVHDQSAALEALIEIGIARVLTKGGATTALDGADSIRALVDQAAGRIAVMAGGSIRESNVEEIVRRSGVREIHSRGLAVAEMLRRANAAAGAAPR
jgi:copper homeostasis protein